MSFPYYADLAFCNEQSCADSEVSRVPDNLKKEESEQNQDDNNEVLGDPEHGVEPSGK